MRANLSFGSVILISLLLSSPVSAVTFIGNVANITDGAGNQVAGNLGGVGTQGNAWALSGGNTTNRGVRLDFAADELGGGVWQYTYTFQQGSAAGKNIDHFDLQVGNGFSASDLLSATVAPLPTSGPVPLSTSPSLITEPLITGAIPNNSLTGYQWVFPTATLGFTVTITSDRAPVWGDFMVLSSDTVNNPPGLHLAAWNSMIGVASNDPIVSGMNDGGRILVPGAVPEPSTFALLGVGVLGLVGWMRKKSMT